MTISKRVLIGTTKGVFFLEKNGDSWDVNGPFCKDWPINHIAHEDGTYWAVGGNEWWGAGVWKSTDNGENWTVNRMSPGTIDDWIDKDPGIAQMFGIPSARDAQFAGKVQALWSLKKAGNRLYSGGKPGFLMASDDNGETWEMVTGLTEHESRETWNPGGAGLTVHTLLSDPDDPSKVWTAISAAGVFATEDGGATWERRNNIGNTGHDCIGDCVHNMSYAAGGGDRIYQQNHHGVYRSNDGGRSWTPITDGLPSDFGFPIMAHPTDPDTVFVLPLNGGDKGRFPVDASAAVWRSRDAGETWEKTQNGLPDKNCYFTVLRQSMASDKDGSIYFGTNSGSVFATFDEGDNWTEIARHLPTVLCVETA